MIENKKLTMKFVREDDINYTADWFSGRTHSCAGRGCCVCLQAGQKKDQRPNPMRRAEALGYPVANLLSPVSSMCLWSPDTNETNPPSFVAAVVDSRRDVTKSSPINRNKKTLYNNVLVSYRDKYKTFFILFTIVILLKYLDHNVK